MWVRSKYFTARKFHWIVGEGEVNVGMPSYKLVPFFKTACKRKILQDEAERQTFVDPKKVCRHCLNNA